MEKLIIAFYTDKYARPWYAYLIYIKDNSNFVIQNHLKQFPNGKVEFLTASDENVKKMFS